MWWLTAYRQLFHSNVYGETAAKDAQHIAFLVDKWIQQHGCRMSLSVDDLAHQILKYIAIRGRLASYEISGPHMPKQKRSELNSETQLIWDQWIAHTFEYEVWNSQIILPVFGSQVRLWEMGREDWRYEIFAFLPRWIDKDPAVLERIDPRPLPDIDVVGDDPRDAKIDPYLLEHGGRKGRRLRGGHAAAIPVDEA